MRFTNLGGATGIIEQGGKRMLLDPWLDDGIMHGSWYHYPPASIGPDELGHIDYVYISHIHEDHCSPGTIREINRDAEIIIAARRPNFVRKMLDREGYEFAVVHEVEPMHPREIAPGLCVDILTADPEHDYNYAVDSALVVQWDGVTVYDANDCAPYPGGMEYLTSTYPNVDLALLPYATGSSYPACFLNLSHDEKIAERERLRRNAIATFIENVRRIGPRRAAPFADQYVVGGSRADLNIYLPHPPGTAIVADALAEAGLADVGLFLNPGQTIDLDTGALEPDEPLVRLSDDDRHAYVTGKLSEARYDHEKVTFASAVPVRRLLDAARAQLWSQQQRERWFPEWTIVLDVRDRHERFVLPLATDRVLDGMPGDPLPEPALRIQVDSTLLAMLLIGHVSWNMADSALFLDYERVPNVYDPHVFANLNHLRV